MTTRFSFENGLFSSVNAFSEWGATAHDKMVPRQFSSGQMHSLPHLPKGSSFEDIMAVQQAHSQALADKTAADVGQSVAERLKAHLSKEQMKLLGEDLSSADRLLKSIRFS